MARSCGVEGVRVDRAADIGEAIRKGIAANKPYLIDVDIAADTNPRAPAYGNCLASAAASRELVFSSSRNEEAARSRLALVALG